MLEIFQFTVMKLYNSWNEQQAALKMNALNTLVRKAIGPCRLKQGVEKEYFAVIIYDLADSVSLPILVNNITSVSEWTLLYHAARSAMTTFGHSCCLYTPPAFGWKLKVTLETGGSGLIERGMVTVYYSMEQFYSSLVEDLGNILTSDIIFEKIRPQKLLADFTV